MKHLLIIFVAVFYTTSCFAASNPKRRRDSVITSTKRSVPQNCHNSLETIECFQQCYAFQERHHIPRNLSGKAYFDLAVPVALGQYFRFNNIPTPFKESMQNFGLEFFPGLIYPCPNKCETDPNYWRCIYQCEDKDVTLQWSSLCLRTKLCDVTKNYFNESCVSCLTAATKKQLKKTCEIAYFPDLPIEAENYCEQLSTCALQNGNQYPAAPPNIRIPIAGPLPPPVMSGMRGMIEGCASYIDSLPESPVPVPATYYMYKLDLLEMCVNDWAFQAQRRCCYSPAFRKFSRCEYDKNNTACDDMCLKILPGRLCRQTCEQNQEIASCIEGCQILHPTKEKDLCHHCGTVEFDTAAHSIQKCNNISAARKVIKTADTGVKNGTMVQDSFLLTNCLNKEYISEFANFIGFPIDASSAQWMGYHLTVDECVAECMVPKYACIVKCLRTTRPAFGVPRSILNMCRRNTFRAINVLTCALKLELENMKLETIIKNVNRFISCDNENDANNTSLLVHKGILLYENTHVCPVKCRYENIPLDQQFLENYKKQFLCAINNCQPTGKSKYCKPKLSDHIVELSDFSTCRWRIDFSKIQSPGLLWQTYFNELGPIDIKHKLEYPDTTPTLQKTNYRGSSAFFSFPYFLIVRALCDTGYYEDSTYRYFMIGENPVVELSYRAPTSRHHPASLFKGVFQTSLIKLTPIENDEIIPENPKAIAEDDGTGCHGNVCYPGFAIPMVLLHNSEFDVHVSSQEVFSDLKKTVYVSPFHSRSVDGSGEIQVGSSDFPGHFGMLFPRTRSSVFTDTEIHSHFNCTADEKASLGIMEDISKQKCPEIVHLLDDFDRPYPPNLFGPLDPDDIIRSQYTHLTSPVQTVAGFYDPKYVLIGDADMNKLEVVDWKNLLKGLEKNPMLHSCVQSSFTNRGFPKPIYSQLDRTDFDYPIKYYRQKYAAKSYYTDAVTAKNAHPSQISDTAIFEAISLEDRLLLITTKGLVSYYGHSNATVAENKAWSYNETEVLNKCFKFVKILPTAQQVSDTVIGITYDYLLINPNPSEPPIPISQQIWVGKYTYPGKPIVWQQLRGDRSRGDNIIEQKWDSAESAGTTVHFPPNKNPGVALEVLEASPRSEVESICFKTYREYLEHASRLVTIVDEPGWCEAIDATPVMSKNNKIQVLVRLRATHTGIPSTAFRNDKIYLYVVASTTFKPGVSKIVWTLDNILPRYPCIDDHHEAVKNAKPFDLDYFKEEYFGGQTNRGCHQTYRLEITFHIFLSGMTYTRSLNNNLFVYGSRLLQSTDSGRSFVYLKSFPRRLPVDVDQSKGPFYQNIRNTHRIVQMAFDSKGHYAFLTNKLELWYGTTSSTEQLLLRPSARSSMLQISLSRELNLNDAVPFSIHYDNNDKLYELVAITNDNGEVSRVMKRPVREGKRIRIDSMLKNLGDASKQLVNNFEDQKNLPYLKKKTPFTYDVVKYISFCPYVSPRLSQNYTVTSSRTQGMYFPNPLQHLALGKPHIETSLMVFQAVTFPLVWNAYYAPPVRYYADRDKDVFQSWIDDKRDQGIIGFLRFAEGNPEAHGIVVEPRKSKRVADTTPNMVIYYYIDYNIVVELRLEFSVKNEFLAHHTDFSEHQIQDIQLNSENADGSIISLNTEREEHDERAAVVYIIRISAKKSSGLPQNLPGHGILPVPITFHLIGAFGNCIPNKANGIVGDAIETIVLVGCPPSRDFVFNWNSTLDSIRFREDTLHGTDDRCYDKEFVCFFARSPLVLHFDIFDEAKQVLIPYTGKYIMRIIGGGRNRDMMKNFTKEEIDAYNIPGVSDVSLIWNEWDAIRHQKVEQEHKQGKDQAIIGRDAREAILSSGVSSIIWSCHTLSPCARISPTKSLEVVYWFRILITNRLVDNDTLCLYEKEFDVMMYGFPPSPEYQLLATIGFCMVILGILYVTYLCFRGHHRLWLSTKVNVYNWFHIIKDAFPKKLRLHEPPMAEEVTEKRKHTGSQQGIARGSNTSLTSSVHGGSSVSSLESPRLSTSSQILPTNRRYSLPEVSKEIVYDQILNKRLKSIVEKNQSIRDNLIKKASAHHSDKDMRQELHFEQQFGRTVSEESVFTPPMPKDKRRGRGLIDYLF